MNKILRFSLVALLAMVGYGTVMAEDIIWQEDFSSYAKDDVPSGGSYSYACENGGGTTKIYEQNLAGGTAPELLVAKSNGSFTAVVPLGGKSGEVTLAFLTNRDDLKVEVSGGTLGDNAGPSLKSRIYPITVASGTESVTIKFYMTTTSNARLDNIKLYQGTAKKPAGLSWGKASTTVTLGGDYSNIPTLQNSNNLTVKCSSSAPEVATVTDAGVITVVGAGETTISAVFEGNDEYDAQTVTIDITVKPAETPVDPDAKGGVNNPYTIEEAAAALEAGTATGNVYVKGYITNIDEVSTQYGNATFKVATENNKDAELKLKAFRAKYLENTAFTAEDQIKEGDQVVLYGKLVLYGSGENVEGQLTSGYIYSLNGNTSGINAIQAEAQQGKVYNLQGQRMEKAVKGLYIVGGKKVIVK